MVKIDSFKVDHRKLLPGLYVSRVDYVNEWPVTTFDLRVCRPNHDHMEVAAAHTLEHIIATLLRSDPDFGDSVIYFGPMGCMTGFYLVVKGDKIPPEILKPLIKAFDSASKWEESIPGVSERECGNYRSHSLELAKKTAQEYASVLHELENTRDPARMKYTKPKMLILTAMKTEMEKIASSLPNFIKNQYEVSLRLTGIGKVNAAMNTQQLILEEKPDVVLNYGFCGAFDNTGFCYEPGVGVCVSGALYNDVWCGCGKFGQVQGMPWKFDTMVLDDSEVMDFLKAGLCKMVLHPSRNSEVAAFPIKHYILSGDKFIDDSKLAEEIKSHFEPYLNIGNGELFALVDMESAAIAQVCYANNVPLIIFKVVSDVIGRHESPEEHINTYERFKESF